MDDKKPVISDLNVIRLANERFGTAETVKHYVRKAKQASDRAKVAVTLPNTTQLAHEVAIMSDAIDKLNLLLGEERVSLPQVK